MTLSCAACRETLVETDVRGEPALGCPRCDGHWLDDAALGGVVAACTQRRSLESLVEFEDGSPRHLCPVCREEMASVWLEMLRFQRCTHGYWIDRPTLARLLANELAPPLPSPEKPKRKLGGLVS
jgi:Zn-finger nucleic acid-binding protein